MIEVFNCQVFSRQGNASFLLVSAHAHRTGAMRHASNSSVAGCDASHNDAGMRVTVVRAPIVTAERADQLNAFTARAITSPRIASEMRDCNVIASFAHGAIGIASVGLKAVAFVNPR